MDMTDDERVIRVLNGWIHDYRMWLKDGHPNGLHPKAKDALIERMAEEIRAAKASMPPADVRHSANPGSTATKKGPSKPKTLKQREREDQPEA